MRQLEVLTNAIARRKIKVIFAGSGASTDGGTITLPAFGLNSDLSNEQIDLISGYCDHETGHVVMSDMKVWNEAPPYVKSMLNLLEDIRVEKVVAAQYYGAKLNLGILNRDLYTKTKGPVDQLLIEGYRQITGCDFDLPDFTDNVKSVFGADCFERMAAMESTADALSLASDFVGFLNNLPRFPEQKPEQGEEGQPEQKPEQSEEGQPEQKPEQGDEGQGKGENEGDEGQPEQSENGEEGQIKEENEGDEEDEEGESKRPKAKAENWGRIDGLTNLEDLEDKGEVLRQKIDGIASFTRSDDDYTIFSTAHDKVLPGEEGHDSHYEALRSELGPLNTARARIVQMFRAKVASKWSGNKESGKLNNRRLARTAVGDVAVFREKRVSVETDTAAMFLVDCSASMNEDNKINDATKAVILFLEVLSGAGIKTEVLGYTTCGKKRASGFTRLEALRTYVFKTFAEPMSAKVKRMVAGIPSNKKKNNCDCESLRIAFERLKVRKEARKIMFVLTDGNQAFYSQDYTPAASELGQVIKDITRAGVELIAIDLHSGHAANYYPKAIKVTHRDNLADKLIGELKNLLMV